MAAILIRNVIGMMDGKFTTLQKNILRFGLFKTYKKRNNRVQRLKKSNVLFTFNFRVR